MKVPFCKLISNLLFQMLCVIILKWWRILGIPGISKVFLLQKRIKKKSTVKQESVMYA